MFGVGGHCGGGGQGQAACEFGCVAEELLCDNMVAMGFVSDSLDGWMVCGGGEGANILIGVEFWWHLISKLSRGEMGGEFGAKVNLGV